MDTSKKDSFSGRGFVSVCTTLAFAALVMTGTILFITPPGRIANWTGWRILGLTKDQWSALHICFAAAFLIAGGFHIYLNWRPLLSYFKSRLSRRFSVRGDWALAILLFVVVGAGTLAEVPPFSSLMTLNETVKDSWETKEESPPIPHAELLTLRELADESDVGLDAMTANLEARGITVASADIRVGDLAEAHNMTPNELYAIATGTPQRQGSGGGAGTGGGMGRKTLARFCADEGLDLAAALEKLRAAGIDADAEMTLHDIADRADIPPSDLRGLLQTTP